MIVYISIGNSDDKLPQHDWADYHRTVESHISNHAHNMHGRWTSFTVDPWQNACWCVETDPGSADALKAKLARAALAYQQDSIAWAVADTEFIRPAEGFSEEGESA